MFVMFSLFGYSSLIKVAVNEKWECAESCALSLINKKLNSTTVSFSHYCLKSLRKEDIHTVYLCLLF